MVEICLLGCLPSMVQGVQSCCKEDLQQVSCCSQGVVITSLAVLLKTPQAPTRIGLKKEGRQLSTILPRAQLGFCSPELHLLSSTSSLQALGLSCKHAWAKGTCRNPLLQLLTADMYLYICDAEGPFCSLFMKTASCVLTGSPPASYTPPPRPF